jgi:rRNA maturation endonuclease Nob1
MIELTPRTMAQSQLEAELNVDKPEWFRVTISQGDYEVIRNLGISHYVSKTGKIFKQRALEPWKCYDCGQQVTRTHEEIYCAKCL